MNKEGMSIEYLSGLLSNYEGIPPPSPPGGRWRGNVDKVQQILRKRWIRCPWIAVSPGITKESDYGDGLQHRRITSHRCVPKSRITSRRVIALLYCLPGLIRPTITYNSSNSFIFLRASSRSFVSFASFVVIFPDSALRNIGSKYPPKLITVA